MKSLKLCPLLLLITIVFSCSSDDSNNPGNETVTGNYFPSTVGDFWTFDIVSSSDDDPAFNFTAIDLLEVATGTSSSYTLEVNNNTTPANGAMSAFLVNGTLSRAASTLEYDGTIELPPEFSTFFDSEIILDNVILYDLNAANNTELSSNSDTFTQDLDLGTIILPLTINYTFTSTKTGTSTSETVGGATFNNVTKTRLNLSVEVTTVIEVLGVPTTFSILDTQNVLTIDNEFAENVGLIEAKSTQGYMLSTEILNILNVLGIDLGVPESLSVSNIQELESYSVTN